MGRYRDVKRALTSGFSYGIDKAKELVRRRRIYRLVCGDTHIYVVLGFSGDYVVIPDLFCSCKDYELNVVLRGNRPTCYHLLAVDIAQREGVVRDVKLGSIDMVKAIIYECIYLGRSDTLRKIVMGKFSPGGGSS